MTAVTEAHPGAAHGTGPRGWGHLRSPGFVRALWMTPLFGAIGLGLVLFFRWLGHYDPLWKWETITTVSFLTMMPLGFLAGIGAFDYWASYAIGRPTPEHEDHSSHGARSWRDYFRVNTDHKVIGVQYVVTTFVFFVIGGLMAMLMRAELAQPGTQYLNPQAFNDVVSAHAGLMIFLFIIPSFAGLANFVVPLMLGAPDMAFPRLNA
ncbi:MAG: cytochrome c oxidase subunit, partial [Gaiellaceae bacterium]|nr:cytochrome c oxidase subunit [Gaiellaceae bacterium]